MSTSGSGLSGPIGARLAERLSQVVRDATVDTRTRLAHQTKGVAMQVVTEFTNHVSDEVRAAIGPIWNTLAASPDTPAEVRPLLTHLGKSQGQAWAWIGGTAAGAAMGAGLMDLLSNWLAEPIGTLISQNPRASLSPEQAALAAARGIPTAFDKRHEAAKRGVNGERFEALIELSSRGLTEEETIALLNRGHLTESSAVTALAFSGKNKDYAKLSLKLARAHLTPEVMAAAWARSMATDDEVAAVSKFWGITAEDSQILTGLAGEPPPMEAIITAWRRGILSEADVDRAIIQGPIRNEWIDAMKSLQTQPLPATEAASAVTQGHLSLDAAASKAALSGFTREDFEIIVDNAGLPPGIDFAAEAFNRGLIDDATWSAMFLESRIKNKHIPLMRAMRVKLIPAETARVAYRLGTYSREAALETLAGHGYTPADAEALLALEDVRAREGSKDLTRAQILSLTADEIITIEQAGAMLADIGFDELEVSWQLALIEVDKIRRFVNAVITRVKTGYVNGNLDPGEATGLLEDAGVSPASRDRYFSLWDIERAALSQQLTVAQIQTAVRRGYIGPGDAQTRFEARGYTPQDAQILVRLTEPA